MSKASPFISSSNAGEFSPRMDARVDFDKYQSAISRGLNLVCLPHGGVTRRPGTRYMASPKTNAPVALIPFEPAVGAAYMIEAGALYFRFFKVQGQIESAPNTPVEVVTTYTIDEVSSLRWAQSADVMYLFHPDHPVRKLSHFSDTSWVLEDVAFQDGPWGDINPGTDLEGTQKIINPSFDGGMQGWTTNVTGAGYVSYSSSSRAVLLSSFATSAATATLLQAVTTANTSKIHVLHFNIIGGGQVTLNLGTTPGGVEISTTVYDAGWYSISFTPASSPFYVQFAYTSSNTLVSPGITAAFCYSVGSNLLVPSARTGAITITAQDSFAPFVSTDVGRQIRFEYAGREPGWATITGFTSSSVVTATVTRTLNDTAPCETWRLGAWSETTGYPKTGTFYQQRLFAANTTTQPQTIWATQSGDFENMRPDSWATGATTVQDDDALDFTIASERVNPILWIAGTRRMVVGTSGGIWAIASKGAALTPKDFSADPQTTIAALDAQPIQADTAVLFAQRAKRAIYDLGYSLQVDSFTAADVTILADHITRGNIAQLVYAPEPYSNVWVRMEDGTLGCLTYKRTQNVVGWNKVEMANGGLVTSIAAIPGSDDASQVYSSLNRHEVWMVVKRTINQVETYLIEMMEGLFDGVNRAYYLDKDEWRDAIKSSQVDAFYVDCGLTYSGAAVTSVSGLDHLESETVRILADGAEHPDAVVTSGAVELDYAASVIQVGIGYDWVYRGMKLPFGSQTGPGVGQSKAVTGLVMVLRDSAAFQYAIDLSGEGEGTATLDYQDVPFRQPSDPMDEAVPLFSGEVEHFPAGGFATDPRVVMLAGGSLPWTLLGVAPKIGESEL